ncbi:MAG: hypothetical protein OXF02_01200 [Simkaniaceae bacterium]|nr:hypothetical protein [Simkaniaceae bacterium]
MASCIKNIWAKCAVTASTYGFEHTVCKHREPGEPPPAVSPLLLSSAITTMKVEPLIHVGLVPEAKLRECSRKFASFEEPIRTPAMTDKEIKKLTREAEYLLRTVTVGGHTLIYTFGLTQSANGSGLTMRFIDDLPEGEFKEKRRLQDVLKRVCACRKEILKFEKKISEMLHSGMIGSAEEVRTLIDSVKPKIGMFFEEATNIRIAEYLRHDIDYLVPKINLFFRGLIWENRSSRRGNADLKQDIEQVESRYRRYAYSVREGCSKEVATAFANLDKLERRLSDIRHLLTHCGR